MSFSWDALSWSLSLPLSIYLCMCMCARIGQMGWNSWSVHLDPERESKERKQREKAKRESKETETEKGMKWITVGVTLDDFAGQSCGYLCGSRLAVWTTSTTTRRRRRRKRRMRKGSGGKQSFLVFWVFSFLTWLHYMVLHYIQYSFQTVERAFVWAILLPYGMA